MRLEHNYKFICSDKEQATKVLKLIDELGGEDFSVNRYITHRKMFYVWQCGTVMFDSEIKDFSRNSSTLILVEDFITLLQGLKSNWKSEPFVGFRAGARRFMYLKHPSQITKPNQKWCENGEVEAFMNMAENKETWAGIALSLEIFTSAEDLLIWVANEH